MDASDRFIALYDLPCPYRDKCKYGKVCRERGWKVVECEYYQMFSEEEARRLRELVESVKKNRK